MSWLRNLQGQLSELANEVLTEATEEVADPESELQVSSKRCSELESQLLVEQTKSGTLEKKIEELEQQLYSVNVEMDNMTKKYGVMVDQRDEEVKRLKIEVEQLRSTGWRDDMDDHEERIEELQKEVAHWKNIVKNSPETNSDPSKSDIEAKLEELRLLKDGEIAALIEQHSSIMNELRESYEERISAIQCAASSSTSNIDLLDTVLLEKEELLDAKRKLEEMTNRKVSEERPVVVDLYDVDGDSDRSSEDKIKDLQVDQSKEDEIAKLKLDAEQMQSLRRQNEELLLAYNDLNEEYEQFKLQHGTVTTRNNDLTQRIDYLKANLIEYEERYEMCKKENAETVKQLEQLNADFERLRTGFDEAKEKSFRSDTSVNEEMDRLRVALEDSRDERARLRDDVDRFRSTVEAIDVELDGLRDSNRRLMEENSALSATISRCEESMSDVLTRNSDDLTNIRQSFDAYQASHGENSVANENLLQGLREEVVALENKNSVLEKQAVMLQEACDLMKQHNEKEVERASLLEQKANLVESRNTELLAKLSKYEAGETFVAPTSSVITDTDSLPVSGDSDAPASSPSETSLTQQLREALAAISEETNQCERVRHQLSELEKEVTVRQGCVDDLIIQNNVLQVQYQQAAEANMETKQALIDKEREYRELELELVHLRDIHDAQTAELEKLSNSQNQPVNETDEKQDHHWDSSIVDAQAKELRTAREQVQSLESRVEELVTQVVSLTETCKQQDDLCGDVTEHMKTAVDSLSRKHADHIEALSNSHESSSAGLKAQNDLLMTTVATLELTIEEQSKVMESLKEATQLADRRADSLVAQLTELEARLPDDNKNVELNEHLSQLTLENEQLKQVATQKHSESVSFYEKLEEAVAQIGTLQSSLSTSERTSAALQENLDRELSESRKRQRELTRLKEHLVLVEETSTREAVEAEQRETDLRAMIRDLQHSTHAVEEGASESTMYYKGQITELTARVTEAERSVNEWKTRFESENQVRLQTSEALTSLQGVVRELSSDHEKESARSAHRCLELQSQIQDLQSLLSTLRQELERLSLDKQAAEESAESSRDALAARQKIIGELELQLEEMRVVSHKAPDNYRIDDSVLRQLFLNYFMAPLDKKADIALLLASILEYPADDIEKIRQSVRPGGASANGRRQGTTLSEQFIRFLESESESARTAPHLPVPSNETTSIRDSDILVHNSNSGAASLNEVLR